MRTAKTCMRGGIVDAASRMTSCAVPALQRCRVSHGASPRRKRAAPTTRRCASSSRKAPGGSTDLAARIVVQRMGEAMGQTFVVDNRPGAGSLNGTETVAKAAPDGYTLLAVAASFSINPSLHEKLPFDPDPRLRADHAARGAAAHPRRAPLAAGEDGEGPDRARESEAGRAQLRIERRRDEHASRGRAFPAHDRNRHGAGALTRAARRAWSRS